jgi:hypothetical protein
MKIETIESVPARLTRVDPDRTNLWAKVVAMPDNGKIRVTEFPEEQLPSIITFLNNNVRTKVLGKTWKVSCNRRRESGDAVLYVTKVAA